MIFMQNIEKPILATESSFAVSQIDGMLQSQWETNTSYQWAFHQQHYFRTHTINQYSSLKWGREEREKDTDSSLLKQLPALSDIENHKYYTPPKSNLVCYSRNVICLYTGKLNYNPNSYSQMSTNSYRSEAQHSTNLAEGTNASSGAWL